MKTVGLLEQQFTWVYVWRILEVSFDGFEYCIAKKILYQCWL